ncbi:pentapeptide repeat-containing protein [Dactylosporangium sp. NPDC051541]|uniref:pentapeptide repeat-containing protein n=1 Tax=Dactylosporangium sp. NPDC051541 TaxID=3363977 RepID=UPI0037900A0F
MSVLLVAAGLIYTNDANRKQQRATQDQIRIAQDGQLTERFSKAVEQLGQEGPGNVGLRLGGIYALERLMADSPRDEPTVIEVLCAFIRTHAAPPAGVEPAAAALPASPPDIHAAVTVLGRRPDPGDRRNVRLDLAGARISMPAAGLAGAHLGGADLSGANLRAADLSGADLHDVDLTGADLRDVRLGGANLRRARLSGADLSGADLRSANLVEADLSLAGLRRATLQQANLTFAAMRGADLGGADLSEANLSGAFLRLVNLSGANLSRANLFNADLTDADLRGSDLRYTDVSVAIFGQVEHNAEVAGRALRCTLVNDSTRLPPGAARPANGASVDDPACR